MWARAVPSLLLLLLMASGSSAQGLSDIAGYPFGEPQPLDVAVGPDGDVFVLRDVPLTPLLLVQQLDRDGSEIGPELSVTGEGGSGFPQRIAAGPEDDVFVLTDDTTMTERQIIRLTPGQGNVVIASYSTANPGSGAPQDLSVSPQGEILVLRDFDSVLAVQRLDRTGAVLGPDLGLEPTGPQGFPSHIAAGENGDVFVQTVVPAPQQSTEPGVVRLGVGMPPETILTFDPFNPSELLDVSASPGGDLALLRRDPLTLGNVVERYDRDGNPTALPFPLDEAGGAINPALAAGMADDVFALTASGVSGDAVLRRLALALDLAAVAAYDPLNQSPSDVSSDDFGNVIVLKSLFSTLLLERRDREGTLLGPDLVVVTAGAPISPPVVSAGGGLDLFVTAEDLIDPQMRVILRVSEIESPVEIESYNSATITPLDLSTDGLGDLVVLTQDTLTFSDAFVERLDRDGNPIGTPVPLAIGSGAIDGPRIAGTGAGNAYVLAEDPVDPTIKKLYYVPAGGPADPIVDFVMDFVDATPIPADLAADPDGNVIVVMSWFGLPQLTVERYDPTGALIDDLGATPDTASAPSNGPRLTAGRRFDRFVLEPNGGSALSLYRLSLADPDGDGIPDDGDFSLAIGDTPCATGVTELCDDNCPLFANPGQADDGSVASLLDPTGALPDGIGNACQCSDTSADGSGTGVDEDQLRTELLGLSAPLAAPELCNVRGPADAGDANGDGLRDDCDVVDAAVLARAFDELGPGVAPVCGPAQGLP